MTSHIFLLTDGAIWDVQKCVNLVASKSNLNQRLHTFGVGNGASEELIKQCAFKGFGHFNFIYNEQEIEERVVSALTKPRLNYKILQNIKLFDQQGNELETPMQTDAQPLLEGEVVDLTYLLPAGMKAHRYSVEILEPNGMTTENFAGVIQATRSYRIVYQAVL